MAGSTNVNGCGACDGFWKWLKPPHKNFFENECNHHDELYEIGGTALARKEADRELFFSMVWKATHYFDNRNPISLWWFVTLALAYYGAVRIFGKPRFKMKS